LLQYKQRSIHSRFHKACHSSGQSKPSVGYNWIVHAIWCSIRSTFSTHFWHTDAGR
jgi:hypothetical protein